MQPDTLCALDLGYKVALLITCAIQLAYARLALKSASAFPQMLTLSAVQRCHCYSDCSILGYYLRARQYMLSLECLETVEIEGTSQY